MMYLVTNTLDLSVCPQKDKEGGAEFTANLQTHNLFPVVEQLCHVVCLYKAATFGQLRMIL